MTDCDIRPLGTLQEMQAAVALQRSYWGDDPEAIVPGHMLFTLAQHGGHVLAAQERAGGRMVAILVGLPGTDSDSAITADSPYLVSKRMVVHAAWRNRGLALRLKLAQRERALAQGIRLVRWTFDPLLAPNAWLNLRKLGAQATHFHENYFGAEGPGGGSPDRLLVDWRLDSERVRALAAGEDCSADLAAMLAEGALLLNKAAPDARGLPVPGVLGALPDAPQMLLELPADFPALAQADEALAQDWRAHMRAALNALFAAGFLLQDCVRGTLDGQERICYVCGTANGERST